MLIEKQNNEIVIKISSEVNSYYVQKVIDYIRFLEIASKSKAKQKDIDSLAKELTANWWKKNKKRFIK